jgi:hypothetical protein
MRISATRTDPGFETYASLSLDTRRNLRILLDGHLLDPERYAVVTADEEAGLIEAFEKDAKGRLKMDRESDSLPLVTLRGKVTIEGLPPK